MRALYLAVCVVVVCLSSAQLVLGSTVIYNGSSLPMTQGWVLRSGAGHLPSSVEVATSQDGALDVLSVETTGMQYHFYELLSDHPEFLATFHVYVDEASHNSFDAGFMISGLTSVNGRLSGVDRTHSVYIEPDRIGFMDDSEPAYFVTPATYHSYSLLQENGRVSVFVDNAEDEILAGNVAPVITRATGRTSDGTVRFGDSTNDPGVNSRYRLSSITFTPVSSVPESTSRSMVSLALLSWITFVRRNRSRVS